MLLDLHNNIKFTVAEPPVAAVTDDTAYVSSILDTANYGAHEFVGIFGTNTDANATFAVLVEYSAASDMSGAAAVPDDYLLGIETMGLDFADDNKTFKIGYIGPLRYIRVTLTPTGNTGNIFFAAMWVQTHTRKGPLSDQVV